MYALAATQAPRPGRPGACRTPARRNARAPQGAARFTAPGTQNTSPARQAWKPASRPPRRPDRSPAPAAGAARAGPGRGGAGERGRGRDARARRGDRDPAATPFLGRRSVSGSTQAWVAARAAGDRAGGNDAIDVRFATCTRLRGAMRRSKAASLPVGPDTGRSTIAG